MSLFADDLARKSSSSTNWVHAHCDGGSRGNPGPAGYGAVVTDGSGSKLAELSQFLGTRTNNYAEYSGLLAVLEWALANGRTPVKVVSDSELMVKQIQGKYKVNSPDLKPLWQQAAATVSRSSKASRSRTRCATRTRMRTRSPTRPWTAAWGAAAVPPASTRCRCAPRRPGP